jgi:hypothetical protein
LISNIDIVARLLVSMPDVTLTFNEGDAYKDKVRLEEMLSTLTFHELAHVSHAYFAGFRFWERVVRAETANSLATNFDDPYRDGTKPNWTEGEVIGLAESWASFIAYKIDIEKRIKVPWSDDITAYNATIRPGIDFAPYFDDQIAKKGMSWRPMGLFWDLHSAAGRGIYQYVKDNSTGKYITNSYLSNTIKNIPIRSLYEHLRYAGTITDYKNVLSNQQFWYYENGQWKLNKRQDILELFKVYGY